MSRGTGILRQWASLLNYKDFSALVVRGLEKELSSTHPHLSHLLPRVLFFHVTVPIYVWFLLIVFPGIDLKAQCFAENGISLRGLSQADAVVKITIPVCLEF